MARRIRRGVKSAPPNSQLSRPLCLWQIDLSSNRPIEWGVRLMRILPLDFVISYNQERLDLASEAMLMLQRQGLIGWIDAHIVDSDGRLPEEQIRMAFEGARFIICLITRNYRSSAWCNAEIEQALAAERALPLRQLLVLTECCARVPEHLRLVPRFELREQSGIYELARYIRSRRPCQRPSRNVREAFSRWNFCRHNLLQKLRGIHPSNLRRLNAIDSICSWFAAHQGATNCPSEEEISFDIRGQKGIRSGRLPRDAILPFAFSDTIETDRVPFHHFLYIDVLEYTRGLVSCELREAIYGAMWNQLLMLTCASNRFFREQMLELAEVILRESSFALFDEFANNHFMAASLGGWPLSIEKAIHEHPNLFVLAASSRIELASSVEHILLSRWQKSRKDSSRLIEALPIHERIRLAGRVCLQAFQSWILSPPAHPPSQSSHALGLDQSDSSTIASPIRALERMYFMLKNVLPVSAVELGNPEEIERLRKNEAPFTTLVLSSLKELLLEVIPSFIDALESRSWRCHWSPSSNRCLFFSFLDHLIPPYLLLFLAGLRDDALRSNMKRVVDFAFERGKCRSTLLYHAILSRLDTPEAYSTLEFTVLMLQGCKELRLEEAPLPDRRLRFFSETSQVQKREFDSFHP